MNKVVIIVVSLCFVGISLYVIGYVLPFTFVSRENYVNRSNCNDEQMAKKEKIDGVILRKFRDNKSHMWKTIEYQDSSGTHETLIFRNDESGGYEFLMQGDSIFKMTDSMAFEAVRDGQRKVFNLKYGCK